MTSKSNTPSTQPEELLPVLALRNTVLFPQQVIPIYIGREKSLELIEDLPENDKKIAVVAQKNGSLEDPSSDDLYNFGSIAQVLKVFNMPDGSKSAIVQGLERAIIDEYQQITPYFTAIVRPLGEQYEPNIEIDALVSNLKTVYEKLINVAPYLSEEHKSILSNIQHPGRMVDRALQLINVSVDEKQGVLEELDIHNRLEKATIIINREIQRIELGEMIQSEVQDEISKTQREYFLREQLKKIKKELGEDEGSVEMDELKEKLNPLISLKKPVKSQEKN